MTMKKLLVVGALVCLMFNGSCAWADDTPLWQKMLDAAQQAYDAGKYSKAARNWSKVADMLRQAAENVRDQVVLATCLKHLGDCHRLRERWQEAGTCYQDSLTTYTKLAPETPDVASGMADLSSCYKNIVLDSLGEQAAKLLKQAGAVCLSSFKKGDGDHFELALADTYRKVVNEDRIEEVRFNKRICFDFVQTPEGKLSVSKIKGVEVKADVCWVEPRSTIMYLDDKGETTADVTVDALGFMKTVTISPPRQIYDYIVELVKQVNKGPVANAATPPVNPPSTSVVAPVEMPSDAAPQASGSVPSTLINEAPIDSKAPADSDVECVAPEISPAQNENTGKELESVSE